MPIVCKYIPNRSAKRRFRASDVGRVACYALDAGYTEEQIIAELKKRCMPNLCRKEEILKELAEILEDVLIDLLTGRLGRVVRILRDWIRKWPGGRRMLDYMEELTQSVLAKISQIIDTIRQIEQS